MARLPVATDADHVDFVEASLRAGVRRWAGRPVIDVLLHVNGFTAEHVDHWGDALAAVQEQTGMPPVFAVSAGYLSTSDPYLDFSVVGDVMVGR